MPPTTQSAFMIFPVQLPRSPSPMLRPSLDSCEFLFILAHPCSLSFHSSLPCSPLRFLKPLCLLYKDQKINYLMKRDGSGFLFSRLFLHILPEFSTSSLTLISHDISPLQHCYAFRNIFPTQAETIYIML